MGEVAKAAGLTRQTLHQYALLGLIRPQGRTAGGHRRFGARVFRRLDEIRALQTRGWTLARIREHFEAGGRPAEGRGR
jgi:DNA-binding transcriptional MerR regulator